MSKRSMSVIDGITIGYVGLRAGEPLLKVAKGEWTTEGAMTELKYRFGFQGSDGKFNANGSLETYVPPIMMQLVKRGLRALMGRSIRFGPIRFP